jgi:hypothetical protein
MTMEWGFGAGMVRDITNRAVCGNQEMRISALLGI